MEIDGYPVECSYDDREEAWIARIPLLPGCAVDAHTEHEVMKRLRLSKAQWVSLMKRAGKPIPSPQKSRP